VRVFAVVLCVLGLAFTVACGGGGGTPTGIPITVAVSASPTSLNPGQSATVTATVTNASNTGVTWGISPAGFGTLSSTTANPVTYTAPANVPTATAVTITATSDASSSATGSAQISVATSAIGISLSPAAPQTINQGGQVPITATLTNDTSGKGVSWKLTGVGSLSSQTTTSVTYVAPNSVANNTAVVVTATSNANSSASSSLEITVFPSGAGPNVAAISVNGGPVGVVDSAYTSVTICVPSSSPAICQTVDGILVDTGSVGLRVLASQIPGLALPVLTDNSGDTVNDCVQFVDGTFAWGQVETADVEMGSETASGVSIQVIATPSFAIPSSCSGTNADTPQALGANGILGIGPEPTDCFAPGVGSPCDQSTGLLASPPSPNYYLCNSSGCTASGLGPTFVPTAQQVFNPVAAFVTDNNGTLIKFPTPSGNAVLSLSGSLIFGIATESNNAIPAAATVFTMDSFDNFTTIFSGQTLISSFIDSGSNGLFFPDNLPTCTVNPPFFCPTSTTALSATNQSNVISGQTKTTNFNIDSADTLFANNPNDFVFSTLGGPNGTPNTCNTSNGTGSCTFDWGLPIFFPPLAPNGVFTGIDNPGVTTPFWAY